MSVTRILSVHCDECANWEYGAWDDTTARAVRRAVHARGWVRRGGRDLCPQCATTPVDSDPPVSS